MKGPSVQPEKVYSQDQLDAIIADYDKRQGAVVGRSHPPQYEYTLVSHTVKRRNLLLRVLVGIKTVIGWLLLIPGAVASAICGIVLPLSVVLALMGKVEWIAVLGWFVISVVAGMIAGLGMVLTGVMSGDE